MLRKSDMKALPKLLIALATAAAFSLVHPVRANLITNGGFETGDFTGWTQSRGFVEGETFGITPHSGNFQATYGRPNASLTQSVATTAGASYTIDFWLAHIGFPSNSFSVNWGGVLILGSVLTNQSHFDYTEFTFNVTASAGASTALQFNFVGGLIWFLDDVSVNQVGVPDAGSTLPLLGFALLGLAALRRLAN
jgi:hypothetical protein